MIDEKEVLKILKRYEGRMNPTAYFGLEADIVNIEEYAEPTTKNDLGVDREDAVERLNALKQLIGYDKDSEIVKATQKSLDMAIKALEQEPTTKNDLGVDCISRQAVIDAISANCVWENEYNLTASRIKKAVENLPSVTPQEPKTGHWITQWNVVHQKEYYYCSECREEFSYDGETGIKMNDYNFCPNCGAKMVESQESEE